MLEAAAADKAQATPTPVPAPQPLAVVTSGLPLSEIIAQLTAIHAKHPDAQVKRGWANRWEIWPG